MARTPSQEQPADLALPCDVASFDDGVDAVLDAMSSLLGRLEVPTLQAALADLGLPATGNKQSLSERLLSAPNVVVGNEAVSKVLLNGIGAAC